MSKNKMFVYLNRSSLSCDVLFVDSGEVVNMLFYLGIRIARCLDHSLILN
jgi:hypothetical protein